MLKERSSKIHTIKLHLVESLFLDMGAVVALSYHSTANECAHVPERCAGKC